MRRYRLEIDNVRSHLRSLWIVIGLQGLIILALWIGWSQAPKQLRVYVPPDLRSGAVLAAEEVPPANVYAFAFYIFQQLNRWPSNGEEDYARNIHALSPYLTPACGHFLKLDYEQRQRTGELRQRVRGIYEIPGRGFGDDPTQRVRVVSQRDWVVTLDIAADEYHGTEQVKRALVRYPLKVVRLDVDPERNPFGLALDCYDGTPQRIETELPSAPVAPATR